MKLSLSVGVAEAFGSKEKTTMSLDELIRLAGAHGYAALCMRASLRQELFPWGEWASYGT